MNTKIEQKTEQLKLDINDTKKDISYLDNYINDLINTNAEINRRSLKRHELIINHRAERLSLELEFLEPRVKNDIELGVVSKKNCCTTAIYESSFLSKAFYKQTPTIVELLCEIDLNSSEIVLPNRKKIPNPFYYLIEMFKTKGLNLRLFIDEGEVIAANWSNIDAIVYRQ